jgi:hypothetical protein
MKRCSGRGSTTARGTRGRANSPLEVGTLEWAWEHCCPWMEGNMRAGVPVAVSVIGKCGIRLALEEHYRGVRWIV